MQAWPLPSSIHARPRAPDLPEGAAPQGAWGRYRDMAVTGTAGLNDRSEARMIDPDMTSEQALARLEEAG
jgi:hypothetical protein